LEWPWLKKAQLYKREVEKGIKVEGMSGPESTSQKTNSSHISPSGAPEFSCGTALQGRR